MQLFAGNHAEAANAVSTALKLDPNLPPIDREIAGLVFLLQGETEKAIKTLERTRDDAPADAGFRVLLAAAYAREGRLEEAKAAIAEGLRVTSSTESPARRRSLSGWRTYLSHLSNSNDLAVIINAMRQAGLPEWPFNFTADEKNRLNGDEIASLVLGHTLQGELEPDGQPAIMQIARDGTAGFRTITRMHTLRLYVNHDVLSLPESAGDRPVAMTFRVVHIGRSPRTFVWQVAPWRLKSFTISVLP